METRRGKQGPTSERVRRNLSELRKRRGNTVRDLSERLAAVGRPILASGVSKVEAGERRVDVDDLMALAVALRVTPNRLLMTARADDEEVQLTSAVSVPAWAAWRWADGRTPLPSEADGNKASYDAEDVADFRQHARPAGLPLNAAADASITELMLRLARVAQAADDRRRGVVDPIVKTSGVDPAEDLTRRANAVRAALDRLTADVSDLLREAEEGTDGDR